MYSPAFLAHVEAAVLIFALMLALAVFVTVARALFARRYSPPTRKPGAVAYGANGPVDDYGRQPGFRKGRTR